MSDFLSFNDDMIALRVGEMSNQGKESYNSYLAEPIVRKYSIECGIL